MIRGAVGIISTLVFAFSVSFLVAHHVFSEPAEAPQLVAVPASESAAADGPLSVRTLGRAAPLPALRRAPAGPSAALVGVSPPPSAPPSPASSLRAKTAGG